MPLLSFLAGARHSLSSRGDRDVASSSQAGAYPAVDPGIPVQSVDEILAAHQDLLARVKLCYGSDKATFKSELLVSIGNYAAFVNMLPATPDNFFSEAGGLFRLGLEVAFFSLQGTDGHIVSGRATITTRRQLEPRWRQATFLAGLCSELHRALSAVVVINERGEQWPSYLGPLTTWLSQTRSRRFFVRWLANAQESRALGLFALPQIVPAQLMQYLDQGNTIAVPQLLSCLSGAPLYREQNILADLVKRAAALVIDRDLVASANRYGRPILGAHIERYLIDAMRRLVVSQPSWIPNQDRSRVWFARDGLFIVWPNAAMEIRKLLEEDELPGIPKSPETIVEILLSAGVLTARMPGQALWSICPPPGKTVLAAVKLSSPEILLPSYSHLAAPLDALIAVRGNAPPNHVDPQAPAESPPDDRDGTTRSTPAPTPKPATVPLQSAFELSPPCPPFPPPGDAQPAGGGVLGTVAPAAPPSLVDLEPEAAGFKLAAPMRLNPQVRDALSSAVDTLNGDARASSVATVATGLFIPLEHFKKAHIDVSVVLRSLAEAQMTVGASATRATCIEHDFLGQPVTGVVLRPEFVRGLDVRDFLPQAAGS